MVSSIRARLDRLITLLPERERLEALLGQHWMPLAGALGAIALALIVALPLALGTRSDGFVIRTSDGARIVAEVTGSGDRWVLLGHMYPTKRTKPTNRQIWDKFESRLVAEGYRVLSWDFRCHGESPCVYSKRPIEDVPELYLDWEAAIDYAVAHGAREINGIGVSMGGTSLMQVAAYRSELRSVSAISSPNIFPNKPPKDSERGGDDWDRLDGLSGVAEIEVPKLYLVGAVNQCAYWQSKRYFERASEPVRLVVYLTDLHGTEILDDGELGDDAQREVVEFLADPEGIAGKEFRNEAPDVDAHEQCYPPEEEDEQ